jgi:type IX secretion system PorP/SprF family membrane protein
MIRKLLLLVFLFPVMHITAQDFHLAHYDAAKIYLNPAMTGMFDGYYRIHANYRNQWNAVVSKPYQTAALAWDMPIKRLGIGAQIMNNRAGFGNYNALQIALSAAYDLRMDKANMHHVAFGMNVGAIQKSVNFGLLSWDNQYSFSGGGTFDTSIPSGENYNAERIYLLNVSAGGLYYYAKDGARFNPFIGFSAFNLNRPQETFYGRDNQLPIRYVIHAGTRMGVNEKLQLQGRFLQMWQVNDRETVFGLQANIFMADYDSYLIIGSTFRTRDAAIFEVGMKKGSLTYRMSYDINVSTLKSASNNRGGIEFSIIYVAHRKSPIVAPNCPRL